MQGFGGKFRRKASLGRPRRIWEYIGIDLGDIRWNVTDWIDLAADTDQWQALVGMVVKLRFP
jgi:hypothetical protein